MDPVSVSLVAALAAGAVAGATKVASTAVTDAYNGLKNSIIKHNQAAKPLIAAVEADPRSKPEQTALSTFLSDSARSADVQEALSRLLDALIALSDQPAPKAMFDFKKLRAAKLFELSDIEAAGTVLRAEEATFEGDFRAVGLRQRSDEKK